MDIFVSGVTSIIASILKAIAAAGAKAVAKPIRDNVEALMADAELDAKIDTILGNEFTQQLLDIEAAVQGALDAVHKDIKHDHLKRAVHAEMRMFQQRLLDTDHRFGLWSNDPSSPFKQKDFTGTYGRNDHREAIYSFAVRLTTTTAVGPSLTDDILTLCGDD
ncbi:hypothetical protein BV898_15626 [Hypsibius exemplaris]|uniref:Uncharacterized protein n=1 Tax=Hypsibius exemplaris TaxID=2072580 RepID=A0A9X6NKI6_HYPEX|nr:hypothetical protein BV898_15626 [Hypsibius exemplaris]